MTNKRLLTEKDVDYLVQRFKKVFITKEDLARFERELESRFRLIFATKEEFEDFREKINKTLKKHRSDLINKLDRILKEILASRQEQTVLSRQVSGHEDKISTLEKIHPDL